MMPMKPIGPADRHRRAGRQRRAEEGGALRARRRSRPCVSALSTPRLSRLSGRASQANTANDTQHQRQRRDERLVAADVEVAHQPAQRSGRSRRSRRSTGRTGSAPRRTRSSSRRRAAARWSRSRRAARARARRRCRRPRASRRSWRPARPGCRAHANDQPNVIASIAPSAAPAETPSVNGVASGLRSSPWNTTPADASVAADQRAGQRARQPRDEEDLRVDVVGEGHRRVERPPQADAASIRRAARSTIAASASPPKPASVDQRGAGRRAASCRRPGVRAESARRPGGPSPRAGCTSASTPYSSRMPAGVRTSSVGPAASTSPVLQQHERAAQPGGEVQVVRGDDDRQRPAPLQLPQQRRDLELVGEIERHRRLVEQQDRRCPRPRAAICASAAAMMTRCFSPPLSVANGRSSSAAVPVAASASRATAKSAGPSISNAPRCG